MAVAVAGAVVVVAMVQVTALSAQGVYRIVQCPDVTGELCCH